MSSSPPYQLLYVVRPAKGGITNHIQTLTENLTPSLFNVSISGPSDTIRVAGKKCNQLYPVAITDGIRPFWDIKAVFDLCRLLKTCEIDLIHAHGFKAAAVTISALITSRRAGKRPLSICTIHNYPLYRLQKGFLKHLHPPVFSAFDHLITVSDALREHAVEALGAEPAEMTTIHNGIAVDTFNQKEPGKEHDSKVIDFPLPLNKYDRIIGTVGRLVTEKGIQDLLSAFYLVKRSFPETLLLIVGDGPLAEKLKDQAQKLDLDDTVIFAGYRRDIPQILKNLDLFVLPSRSEGLAIALMEAMASGLPVITTRTGGIPEVTGEEAGVLVPPSRPDILAEAICDLLADSSKAEKMGKRAKTRINERFTQKQMVAETENLYLKLIAGHAQPGREHVGRKREKNV